MKSEWRDLMNDLQAQGFLIERARNNHIKITSPSGRKLQVAGTPGNTRSLKNSITRLKRIGYKPEGA